MDKLIRASEATSVREIAIAGGVSANSSLAKTLTETGASRGWRVHIPPRKFTTDNAAMIAVAGYFKYRSGKTCSLDVCPNVKLS